MFMIYYIFLEDIYYSLFDRVFTIKSVLSSTLKLLSKRLPSKRIEKEMVF